MIKILIDTNVLIYGHDRSERAKQRQAIDVIDRVIAARSGRISAQVLSEFYHTTTRKLTPPLTPAQAEAQIHYFASLWTVFDVTPPVVLEAIRGARAYQFSFWDAQVWATARLHQVPVVLSEDLNPGAMIEGVRFLSPFAPDVDLADAGL